MSEPIPPDVEVPEGPEVPQDPDWEPDDLEEARQRIRRAREQALIDAASDAIKRAVLSGH